MPGYIALTYWDLALASILVLIDAGLSLLFGLRIHRSLLIAAARMAVQLMTPCRCSAGRVPAVREASAIRPPPGAAFCLSGNHRPASPAPPRAYLARQQAHGWSRVHARGFEHGIGSTFN